MQTIIQTPTPNLAKSISFYERLNFKVISEGKQTFVSDGKAHVEINEDRFARAGVKIYKNSWKEEIAELEELVVIHKTEDGFLFGDPSNCWIYLIEGTSSHTFTEVESYSHLGKYAGLSLETLDMDKSMKLWSILGHEKTMGSAEQGWVAMQNAEKFGVSFMKPNSCPHLFFNPSLSYFNGGKNLPVIEKIKASGIEFTEEITHFNKEGIVDNVIIRDPGGFGFFVYND